MAKFYKIGHPVEEVKPKDKFFSLKELQKFVGGYIEIVSLGDGTKLICNEEGKLDGLVVNHPAMVAAREHGWTLFPDDYLVGNILLMDDSELEHNEE